MSRRVNPRPYLEQFCPMCQQQDMQVRIVFPKSLYLACRKCQETVTIPVPPESHFVCGNAKEAWMTQSVRRGQIVLYGPGTEQEMSHALTREMNLRGQ